MKSVTHSVLSTLTMMCVLSVFSKGPKVHQHEVEHRELPSVGRGAGHWHRTVGLDGLRVGVVAAAGEEPATRHGRLLLPDLG